MKKTALAILTAALLGLSACSGGSGGAQASQAPSGDVTVSTPPDTPTPSPTPTEDPNKDFKTAVEFTTLTHNDEHAEAARLVKPESPAARYLAHQTLAAKAEKIGGAPDNDEVPTIKSDAKTQSIKVTFAADEPVEGEKAKKPLTYTWKDFTFDDGKITGWTGKSGPVKNVLWTRETTAAAKGRKAVLKSAYKANSGALVIVVELSSKVATGFTYGEYAANGGYRQEVSDQYDSELSKGEKTLAEFVVPDAPFGGKLHIPFTDAEGFDQGEMLLTIK